jgi:hypothetical protein
VNEYGNHPLNVLQVFQQIKIPLYQLRPINQQLFVHYDHGYLLHGYVNVHQNGDHVDLMRVELNVKMHLLQLLKPFKYLDLSTKQKNLPNKLPDAQFNKIF